MGGAAEFGPAHPYLASAQPSPVAQSDPMGWAGPGLFGGRHSASHPHMPVKFIVKFMGNEMPLRPLETPTYIHKFNYMLGIL